MFVALEYLSSQAYIEVHQASIPTPTYYSVQIVQRFGEHGPSQGLLSCNTVLVVVIWSYSGLLGNSSCSSDASIVGLEACGCVGFVGVGVCPTIPVSPPAALVATRC